MKRDSYNIHGAAFKNEDDLKEELEEADLEFEEIEREHFDEEEL